MRILLALLFAAFLQAQDAFLVRPYLQLGDAPKVAARERLDLMWHAEDRDAAWSVEVKRGGGWTVQAAPTYRRLDAPPLPAHRIYRAALRNLTPGELVDLFTNLKPGTGTLAAYKAIRLAVSHLERDRILSQDIQSMVGLMKRGDLVKGVESVVGELR